MTKLSRDVPATLMRYTLSLTIAVGAALWIASGPRLRGADAPKPVEVKIIHPVRGEIIRTITLPGTIRANQQVTLSAKVGGYLKSLAVDRGDRVKAGQLIGEIEVPELIADALKNRAELVRAEAEAKVSDLEAGRLSKAQRQAPDLVLPQAVDNSEGRLAMAKAGVEVARANIERTETLLRYAHIVAPFDGIVTARFVDPGAFIPSAAGGGPAQAAALVTLADFDSVRAQVALPEVEAALAQVGQPVKLTVEGLVGKSFAGKISRMSYALDDTTKTMLIEADLPNPDLVLRPGMYAAVKVGLEKHLDAMTLPVEAIVMEKVNAFAFVIEGGKAKKTAIRIGFNDGLKVEVVSGLTGSEKVALVGKMVLTDGAAVTATEVP
ncbi:MAG: efflux RND transporter periplasmic adaptor subunit [Pedosphaera sp.]|nr:efflux RND transporter periplasmic adaptor subunit [Pedosphaera sp.]